MTQLKRHGSERGPHASCSSDVVSREPILDGPMSKTVECIRLWVMVPRTPENERESSMFGMSTSHGLLGEVLTQSHLRGYRGYLLAAHWLVGHQPALTFPRYDITWESLQSAASVSMAPFCLLSQLPSIVTCNMCFFHPPILGGFSTALSRPFQVYAAWQSALYVRGASRKGAVLRLRCLNFASA